MGSFRRWLASALICALPAWADLSLRWSNLSPIATGQRVEVFTPAATVKGRCTSVGTDSITVGKRVVARGEVQRIRVTRYVGNRRKMGAGIGFIGGMVAGIVALVAIGMDESSQESKTAKTAKATSAWIGIWVGVTLAGWLIGRAADREITEVRIIPEASTKTGR